MPMTELNRRRNRNHDGGNDHPKMPRVREGTSATNSAACKAGAQ